MKLLLAICIFHTIYFYFLSSWTLAMYEDTKKYETMVFDTLLRGSWMLDSCAAELFNCYEIVKADVMCSHGNFFSSVCAVQRDYCHNQRGMRDDYGHRFQMYEDQCLDLWNLYETRRFTLHFT